MSIKIDVNKASNIATLVLAAVAVIGWGYSLIYIPKTTAADLEKFIKATSKQFVDTEELNKQRFESIAGQLKDIKEQQGEIRRLHLAVATTVQANTATIRRNTAHIEETKVVLKSVIPAQDEVKKKIP